MLQKVVELRDIVCGCHGICKTTQNFFSIKFFISFRHQGFKTRTECKGSLFMLFLARDFENHMFHFGEDGFCSDV